MILKYFMKAFQSWTGVYRQTDRRNILTQEDKRKSTMQTRYQPKIQAFLLSAHLYCEI